MKSYLKYRSFHSRKCIGTCCLQKWLPTCLGLNVLIQRGSQGWFYACPKQWETSLQPWFIQHHLWSRLAQTIAYIKRYRPYILYHSAKQPMDSYIFSRGCRRPPSPSRPLIWTNKLCVHTLMADNMNSLPSKAIRYSIGTTNLLGNQTQTLKLKLYIITFKASCVNLKQGSLCKIKVVIHLNIQF